MNMDDVRQMRLWIFGFQISQALHVAAELDIASRLAAGPLRCEALADAARCDNDALYRLLKALESVDVFREGPDGTFSNTPRSQLLVRGEGSLQLAAAVYGGEHYRAWSELLDCIRQGKERFSPMHGMDYFSGLEQWAAAPGKYRRYVEEDDERRTGAILQAYDFSGLAHLVDVGGGGSRFVQRLLAAHGQMRGTVFDTALPARLAQEPEDTALAGRFAFCEGDFRERVPAGADAYLLSHIVHRLDDTDAIALLRRCREAMAPGGRLLIVEMMLKPDQPQDFGRWMDLNTLLVCGGRERSVADYAELLANSGLRLAHTHPLGNGMTLLAGMPD